eukprot:1144735-Pelagomonas_calceolata.AAC.2
MLMGIWRVSGSTRLQNLAVRSIIVFNSMSSGNKLVGVYYRMGRVDSMSQGLGHIVLIISGMADRDPKIRMKGKCSRHQRECLKGQRFSSAGIEGCDPAGRPFLLVIPMPIFGRRYGPGWAGPMNGAFNLFASAFIFQHSFASKEPCNSDANSHCIENGVERPSG